MAHHSSALLLLFFLLGFTSAWQGRKTGGRTEIKDVEKNEEVQEMGRFAVHERNLRVGEGEDRLVFRGVVRAERQVVSGIKYFLCIAAASDGTSSIQCYDAVVLVQPWVGSRQLLHFLPAKGMILL